MHISIIGVGLIGGSLALALQEANYCQRITGIGRDVERLQAARHAGILDEYTTDLAVGIHAADIIVLATPIGTYSDIFTAIKPHLKPGMVLTDVGSAKGSVVAAAQQVWGDELPAGFVPGHPIAGAEKSGFESATANLFARRCVILTPVASTSPTAIQTITAMWLATGAQVETMEVKHHDEVLAATSHLPHLLAFALVDNLAQKQSVAEIFRYAAGGFRDFTRIAASDSIMWRDICLDNRKAILKALQNYRFELDYITGLLEQGDGDGLLELFRRAKTARDKFIG